MQNEHVAAGPRRTANEDFTRDLAQLLQLHIGTQRAGPLFASHQQGSGPMPHVLTRQRVGQIIRDVAGAAGISKRVYPHLLRHTVTTRLLALGMDITELQRFLGHESITRPGSTPRRRLPPCNAASTESPIRLRTR